MLHRLLINDWRRIARVFDQDIHLASPKLNIQASCQAAFGLNAACKRMLRFNEQVDVSPTLDIVYAATKQAHNGIGPKHTGDFAFDDGASFIVKTH